MPILLKLKFFIKEGEIQAFKDAQEELCKVMVDDHPGVICYHIDYPEGTNTSEWVEIYANDEVFAAHLENEKGKEPLGKCLEVMEKVECRCWGNPSEDSKKILAGFGAVYMESGANSYFLHTKHTEA